MSTSLELCIEGSSCMLPALHKQRGGFTYNASQIAALHLDNRCQYEGHTLEQLSALYCNARLDAALQQAAAGCSILQGNDVCVSNTCTYYCSPQQPKTVAVVGFNYTAGPKPYKPFGYTTCQPALIRGWAVMCTSAHGAIQAFQHCMLLAMRKGTVQRLKSKCALHIRPPQGMGKSECFFLEHAENRKPDGGTYL